MAFHITYQPLCEVALWHHHWLDSGGNIFTLPPQPAMNAAVRNRLLEYDVRQWITIRPTDETQALLKQRGLLFKATATGAIIVSRTGYTAPSDDFRISLEVHLQAPQWLNYTDLGVVSIQGQLFYLSNAGAAATARLLLTAGDGGVVRSTHYIPRQGRWVRLPKIDPALPCQVQVFDELSTAVTPVWIFDIPASAAECELDCRSLAAGKYRFAGTNIAPGTWYLGLEDKPALLGIIDLKIKDWEGSVFDIRLAKR